MFKGNFAMEWFSIYIIIHVLWCLQVLTLKRLVSDINQWQLFSELICCHMQSDFMTLHVNCLALDAKNDKFGMYCQKCYQFVTPNDADIQLRNQMAPGFTCTCNLLHQIFVYISTLDPRQIFQDGCCLIQRNAGQETIWIICQFLILHLAKNMFTISWLNILNIWCWMNACWLWFTI